MELLTFRCQMDTEISTRIYHIENGKAYIISSKNINVGITYGWDDCSNICPVHRFHSTNFCTRECQKIHLWNLDCDLHGRHYADVINRLERALNILAGYNIRPGVPDELDIQWIYGYRLTNFNFIHGYFQREILPPKERLSVFAYHLKNILDGILRHPYCFFFGDHKLEGENTYLILSDTNKILCIS